MSNGTPLYKHDCNNEACCKFILSKNGRDFYSASGGQGILIRKSDDGPDYVYMSLNLMIEHNLLQKWID